MLSACQSSLQERHTTVLLLGSLGISLGRWVPTATAGAFAVPVVVIGLFAGYPGTELSVAERLLPWADWGGFRPNLMIEAWPRAHWWHVAYVLLFAGVIAELALLRDAQPRRHRRTSAGLHRRRSSDRLSAAQRLGRPGPRRRTRPRRARA